MRYDVVFVVNTKDADFTWKFDGEPYTVEGKSVKALVKSVAEHLFSHSKSLEIYNDYDSANARLEQLSSPEIFESDDNEKPIVGAKVEVEEEVKEDKDNEEDLADEKIPLVEDEENTGFRESGDRAFPKPKRKA